MKKESLLIKNNELMPGDSLLQTFGCRHSNPDICSNNGIPEKCAFCSKDKICKCPPKSWKKIYIELIKKEEKE